MIRVIFLVLILLTALLPAAAQELPPDYAIRNIRSRFDAGSGQMIVQFEVQNLGGDAAEPATANLNIMRTGETIASDQIPPLQATEIVTVSLPFAAALFPARSVESLRVAVGIDEVEASGSQTIQNNFAQISITFPQVEATPEATAAPDAPDGTIPAPGGDPLSHLLAALNLRVDLSDPTQVAVVVGMGGACLILLLIIVIIARLLFQRPTDFGTWQPPYAHMLPLDPNTTAGRRQQWQGYAQNSSLPAGSPDGTIMARKRLIALDGAELAGWQVTAIRLMQYDMYGRVNRSQVLGPRRLVRRTNWVMRRRAKLSAERIPRVLRPVGTGLMRRLKPKLNERNAMLPLALDFRLQGKHGEVRIVFELYQYTAGNWQRLDQWEPEMVVSGKLVHESFTYTVYGQRPGESSRQFRQRLASDLTQTIAEMIAHEDRPAVPRTSPPTNPHQQPVVIPL